MNNNYKVVYANVVTLDNIPIKVFSDKDEKSLSKFLKRFKRSNECNVTLVVITPENRQSKLYLESLKRTN